MTTSSNNYRTLNGTEIHYTSSGSQQGPLAVLLHGLGGSIETFRDIRPLLPQHYHIISIDIEGFGKTPLNKSKPLSFPRYVSDLHHVISHVQERSSTSSAATVNGVSSSDNGGKSKPKSLLVGHSLGSIISLHYAAQYPSEVAGLLLLGVGRSVRGIPPAQQRMRDLATMAREKGMVAVSEIAVKTNFPADRDNDSKHEQEVRDAVASSLPEAYAATAEVVASDEHFDPDYSLINSPAVFVFGDQDVISPGQRSKDLSSLLGGASEVVEVKSGHQMILQDLEGVKRALFKLLAKL